jgi:hypothetical protein
LNPRLKNITLFITLATAIFSCSIEKKIPANQKLYGGEKTKIVYSDSIPKSRIPLLEETIEEKLQPIQNTAIFGYPYKVGMYYFYQNKTGKVGKFFRKLSKVIIEEPVFFDAIDLERNREGIKQYLINRGYFVAKVDAKLNTQNIINKAEYSLFPGPRYRIDSIFYSDTSSSFQLDFVSEAKKMNLKPYFDLEVMKSERLKVESALREKGYFKYRPEYLQIKADSTVGNNRINISISPKENIPLSAIKQYQINDINVFIDEKPISNLEEEESYDFFRGLILHDSVHRYKEKVFFDAIAFRPGTLYDNRIQSISNNRLLGLNNFKLINSDFQIVNRLDSTLINANYFFQTLKKKSLRAEANAITRSSGLAGSQLSLNWLNNNTFKGAEILKITAKAGLEVQIGGNKDNEYRDNYRVGFEGGLTIPRFLAPFIKIDPENSKVLPKTQLNIGWESFIKTGLYNLNSAKASLGYAWTRGRGIEHSLRPVSLNLVKSTNISTAFIDEIFQDPRLLVILENQFIAGGGYEISINKGKVGRGLFTYNGFLDVAGNMFGLYNKIRNDPEKNGKAFGEYYAQFFRLEHDFRYRYDINRTFSWANRAIVGVGLPYGNSLQLPFVNQFFVGGNNSLRAFRARGVGPGTYERTGTLAEQFLGNNTGDIKLELNTEFRYKINSFFGTALFVDAGNVWMSKDEYIYGPGSLFSKSFLKELAVGAGIGLRLDFSFFIIRLDIATPIRKPWLQEKERWVIDDISLGKKEWRKENVIWNIAVGLPF